MKIFNIIITVLASAFIIYNAIQIDFDNMLSDENVVALITIFASLCAILLMQILMVSKKIEKKAR